MAEKIFILEVTMESRIGERQWYIRRSFPAKQGKVDISRYGYPYSKYNEFEIGFLIGEGYLQVTFNGKGFPVYLNQFHTEKFEHDASNAGPYKIVPENERIEVVNTTFYLYIE